MKPRAVLFDLYNTLIEIRTDEHEPELWAALSRYLRYHGIVEDPQTLHDAYFGALRVMQRERGETYPEIDVVALFTELLSDRGVASPEPTAAELARLLRALGRRRFRLFPDVRPALDALRRRFRLGVVSDAQRIFLEPEMTELELDGYFDVRIVTSDHGYRKPDPRLFGLALDALGVEPDEAVFVGDNAFRDVCGAREAGLQAVLLKRHEGWIDDDRACDPNHTFASLDDVTDWLL